MIQRSERFTKAYDSLIQAFFAGTLAKGTCLGCACGNIIFSAIGTPVTQEDMVACRAHRSAGQFSQKEKIANTGWGMKRVAIGDGLFRVTPVPRYAGEVNEAGYTVAEFARIENAFEQNTTIPFIYYSDDKEQAILEDQYKGLCAVVDVLLELEGEQTGGEELKAKFREHPKLAVA
jgi:hypothetical protein